MPTEDKEHTDPGNNPHRLVREIVGLVFVAFALISLLSIVSFSPADLGETKNPANWIGPVGVRIGDAFLYLFGVGSFILNAFLWYIGLILILGRYADWSWSEIIGQTLFVACASLVSHLALTHVELLGHLPGGVIGEYSGEILRGLFGDAGAYILAGCMTLSSLLLTTKISLGAILQQIITKLHQFQAWIRHKYRVHRKYKKKLAEERQKISQETSPDVETLAKAEARESTKPLVEKDYQFEQKEDEKVKEKLSEKLARWATLGFGDSNTPEDDQQQGNSSVKQIESEANVKSAESDPPPPEGDDRDKATEEPPQKSSSGQTSPAERETQHSIEPTIVDNEKTGHTSLDDASDSSVNLSLNQNNGSEDFELPPVDFLNYEPSEGPSLDEETLKEMAETLEKKLEKFKVEGDVVEICPGPVVTRFEFKPAPGVKISKISNREDDLKMALAAESLRINAPIPGKDVVGIEVPNPNREIVYLKELIADESFINDSDTELPLALGKGTEGEPLVADLTDMPHLLVAGATGSGKSVAINSMVCSLLYSHSPDDLKLIMIDPKRLEFGVYEDIPHLLHPVVEDSEQAGVVLQWAVQEMEKRYKKMSDLGVRNLSNYNEKVEDITEQAKKDRDAGKEQSAAIETLDFDENGDPRHESLPYLVIVVDEFADLLMTSSKDAEDSLKRLSQKARAAGIHLLISTQRPSAKVIDGVIRSNFPARIGLRVSSGSNSRIILGQNGAENLLGKGDMLMKPAQRNQLQRVHGAFVTESEISDIVGFLKEQDEPEFDESIMAEGEDDEAGPLEKDWEKDEYYDDAVKLVIDKDKASISMIQRKFRIGYNRAARIVDRMESEGIVSESDGCTARDVLAEEVPEHIQSD